MSGSKSTDCVFDKDIVDSVVPERAGYGTNSRTNHQSADGTAEQEPSQQADTGAALDTRGGGRMRLVDLGGASVCRPVRDDSILNLDHAQLLLIFDAFPHALGCVLAFEAQDNHFQCHFVHYLLFVRCRELGVLSLHSAGRQSRDDALLEDQHQDDQWDADDDPGGHDLAEWLLPGDLASEQSDGDRYSACLRARWR